MSIREDFILDMVKLMGLVKQNGNVAELAQDILLGYKDELPGDEYEQVMDEYKAGLEKEDNLERILESKKERKTDRSSTVNMAVDRLLRTDGD